MQLVKVLYVIYYGVTYAAAIAIAAQFPATVAGVVGEIFSTDTWWIWWSCCLKKNWENRFSQKMCLVFFKWENIINYLSVRPLLESFVLLLESPSKLQPQWPRRNELCSFFGLLSSAFWTILVPSGLYIRYRSRDNHSTSNVTIVIWSDKLYWQREQQKNVS